MTTSDKRVRPEPGREERQETTRGLKRRRADTMEFYRGTSGLFSLPFAPLPSPLSPLSLPIALSPLSFRGNSTYRARKQIRLRVYKAEDRNFTAFLRDAELPVKIRQRREGESILAKILALENRGQRDGYQAEKRNLVDPTKLSFPYCCPLCDLQCVTFDSVQ